ncbi:MAG: chain-length determining protein [Bacteroidales bacterium]|nr:chain-length determining protein [Bacteroidales bacterium]
MEENNQEKSRIDIKRILHTLFKRKKLFISVWIITFVLSCVWILPQPRYYTTTVSVAPESADSKGVGGLASLASNFGLNLDNGTADAINPLLYPDLFSSTQFIVSLLDIQVETLDGEVKTDYYTYLKDYQKKNVLLEPVALALEWVSSFFKTEGPEIPRLDGQRFNPFHLSKEDGEIIRKVQGSIECTYSRTTDVVTISVTDQDPLASALLADSVKEHLQDYITEYRTKKARLDYEHYKKLKDDAKASFEKARQTYSVYADRHQGAFLQDVTTKKSNLEQDMEMQYQLYSAMATREQAALADLQAKTPVFTTLTNATVPEKPAGPKRIIFVTVMMFLTTVGTIVYLFRKELKEWF